MFKILVVEDEINTRKLMVAVLKNNGFEVFCAENGQEALDIMEKQNVELIVLDIMMPKMDGYELVSILRSVGNNIPILMVSAKHEAQDKRKGFRLGIDDYMVKPVDEEEMVLRIHALLRRAQISFDRKIFIGETVLDYDSYTLVYKDQSTLLPQKEFQLLFKLLSYPGVIFTRLQLMDDIWGMDSDTDDHTVSVHINRLREKVRDNEDFEIITVRGVGYKVDRKE